MSSVTSQDVSNSKGMSKTQQETLEMTTERKRDPHFFGPFHRARGRTKVRSIEMSSVMSQDVSNSNGMSTPDQEKKEMNRDHTHTVAGRATHTNRLLVAAVAVCALICPAVASAVTVLDFDTEDDFVTPLINGQSIDPAFDGADLEFGNLVNISSRQLLPNESNQTHMGVAIFDSTPGGPNDDGGILSEARDEDLLVDTGNILILQNDADAASSSVAGFGLTYDVPNDEATPVDAGAIVFDFVKPVELISIDVVDANGNFGATLTLTDTNNEKRVYTVNETYSFDIESTPSGQGYDTVFLNTLLTQSGEGGGTATVTQSGGFNPLAVVQLDVALTGFGGDGSSPSGGIDTVVFNSHVVPLPASVWMGMSMMGAMGMGGFVRRKRMQTV